LESGLEKIDLRKFYFDSPLYICKDNNLLEFTSKLFNEYRALAILR